MADKVDYGGSATPSHLLAQRRRRGNTLVEFALVALPTFAIITGFFDVTFAMFTWTSLQNAVRSGVRYAITYQTSGSLGQDASIELVVSQNSMGMLTSDSPLIQVNYYSPQALSTPIPSPDGNVPGNIVEVSVQGYPLQWLVPISGSFANPFRPAAPATLNIYADNVMGGLPLGVTSVPR